MDSYEKVLEIRTKLWEAIYKHYVAEELFSIGWFFLIGLTIISYIIWLKFFDKSRLREVLLVGALVAVSMGFADVLSTTMILWSHKVRLVPGVPALFATDYTLFPVMIMLAHQFSESWKIYLLWAGGMSAILAFLVFPLYILVGTMALNKLNYFHIFLFSYFIAILCRAVYIWAMSIEKRQIK